MCRLATVCLLILLPAVLLAATDRPRGSGRNVTGGQGKPEWEWKFGEDPKLLKEKMKEGNVYIRLRGKGTLVIDDQYWLIGSNTTLDGTEAQITIQGSKGLWIRQTENIVIKGLCFRENETAINMSSGGSKVLVKQNTFTKSAWGSPLAFSGYDCDNDKGTCKRQATEISVELNNFAESDYGPLLYYGVAEATFFRNVFRKVLSRIPRAQNQGTFHLCNNYFESWHLGFQGDDGAKFIYENNAFNRTVAKYRQKSGDVVDLKNQWVPNPKENITVCMKGNHIFVDQDTSQLTDGPGMKFNCNFKASYPTDQCPELRAPGHYGEYLMERAGAGDWCHLGF